MPSEAGSHSCAAALVTGTIAVVIDIPDVCACCDDQRNSCMPAGRSVLAGRPPPSPGRRVRRPRNCAVEATVGLVDDQPQFERPL
eukprot:3857911-Prymnesium_polylepis.2